MKMCVFFSSPAIYREEWLNYMADNISQINVSAVYMSSADSSRLFNMLDFPDNVQKTVLNTPLNWLSVFLFLYREQPDFIIFHGYSSVSFLSGIFYSIFSNKTYMLFSDSNVLQRHQTDTNWFARLLLRFVVKKTKYIGFCGKMNKQYWEKMGAKSEQLFPLLFPVNNEKIINLSKNSLKKKEKRKLIGLHEKDFLINYTGRLEAIKDVSTIINAIALLGDRFKLVIIGDGAIKEELIKKAEAFHLLNTRVFFIGMQNNVDVIYWMSTSDVLVLPSKEEPFGLVINEAVASGIPVVASDVCGAAHDLICEDINGYLFKAGDEKDLAEKIIKTEKLDSQKIKEQAKIILEDFSYKQNAEMLYKILHKIKNPR